MEEISIELIKKAKNSKNIKELEEVLVSAGVNCSQQQIQHFAEQLGILNTGKMSDDALEGIAGGKSTINGQDVECADSRVCKAIGLKYDPSWGKSTQDDGREIWQVPYDVYEKALNEAVSGKKHKKRK